MLWSRVVNICRWDLVVNKYYIWLTSLYHLPLLHDIIAHARILFPVSFLYWNVNKASKLLLIFGHLWFSQGSVLGPILFLLYTVNVALIVEMHGINFHSYADDSKLYLHAKADEIAVTLPCVASCIDAIDRWMSSNRLKLNSDKTQFIIYSAWGRSFQK